MASLFFSYCHVDEDLRDRLEEHLALLKHEKLITAWHDRRILAGSSLDDGIDAELETADIILLLVSSAFIHSGYCFTKEMARALERDKAKEARVIPVMLRACDWRTAPFSGLKIVPRDAKPITLWANEDEAFTDVALEIRRVVSAVNEESAKQSAEQVLETTPTRPAITGTAHVTAAPNAANGTGTVVPLPRSSNMRVRKEFTDYDRDKFVRDAFTYIGQFFLGSLTELETRHPEFKGHFDQVDSRHFIASVYKSGAAVAQCTIALGGHAHGRGRGERDITYADGIASHVSGYDESLMLGEDALTLFFKPMMSYSASSEEKYSPSGAAEHYWSKLMDHIQ